GQNCNEFQVSPSTRKKLARNGQAALDWFPECARRRLNETDAAPEIDELADVSGMPEGINQLDAAHDTATVEATTGARIRGRAALVGRVGAMSLAAIYCAALGAVLIGVGGFAVFGIVAVLLLAGGLFAINRLKHSLLGEPILPMDFTLLGHAFRFPSLYFGFLKPATACAIASGVAFVAGAPAAAEYVWGEPARISSTWTRGVLVLAGLSAWLLRHRLAGLIGIADWARRRGFVFDPGTDVRRLGLLPTLAVYDLASGDRPHLARVRATSLAAQTGNRQAADPLGLGAGAKLPDIVLVQAESFFDARRLGLAQPGIDDALVNFARLQRSAFAHGTLDVLSSGGNSLRSEFAVLSGMSATESGVHALNPYHRLARDKVWSLAWHLRALGYRTVAVHPYSGDFFWRNQVYEHLGFERF
ncbi:MAG TPA: sulfatase-like hydrolase/transferase, partial [Roseiflexaceae bacterium]|nr:sulfatase-like hydrolase/transferase [Roseiflexaceae bacterium]